MDPGRQKCGVAVCDPHRVIAHRVVPLAELGGLAGEWTHAHTVDLVIVGSSTGSLEVLSRLSWLRIPVRAIDERGSTLAARRRYFQDHPPRGWKRFLPLSLLLPPEPYDDYAAIVLAEEYLKNPDPVRTVSSSGPRDRGPRTLI